LRLCDDTKQLLQDAKTALQSASEKEIVVTKSLKQIDAIKQNLVDQQNQFKVEKTKLQEWEERNRMRTEELSTKELKLKNREKMVESKYEEAKRLNDETKALVFWHREASKKK